VQNQSEIDDELPLRITRDGDDLPPSFQELVETLVEYWVAGGEHVLMERHD
jgi:hypothetical protein